MNREQKRALFKLVASTIGAVVGAFGMGWFANDIYLRNKVNKYMDEFEAHYTELKESTDEE